MTTVEPRLRKGMRVRLSALGRGHLGGIGRPGELPWRGLVRHAPVASRIVSVVLDGNAPSSVTQYWVGFWQEDV